LPLWLSPAPENRRHLIIDLHFSLIPEKLPLTISTIQLIQYPTANNADQSYKSFDTNVDNILAETTRLLSTSTQLKADGFGSVKNNLNTAIFNENQATLRKRANKLAATERFNAAKSGLSELKQLLKYV